MTITPSKDVAIDFLWHINSPPIEKVVMPFLAMFYIIGIFSHDDIIEYVMMHTPCDYRERCRTMLLIFIQNSNMSDIRNFAQFKTWLNGLCIEADIISNLAKRIGSADISKERVLDGFRSRFLPHITGELVIYHKTNLIGSLIAENIVKYILISTAKTLQEAKAINNRGRQSFESARVDTALEVFISRLTRGIYSSAIKPISKLFMDELEASQGNISTLKHNVTAAIAAKAIRYSDLRKIMVSSEIERANISGKTIKDAHFKIIGGLRGVMGMTTITTCIDMFRTYNKEGSNNEMRHSGSDSVGVLCPLSTGEGRPGQVRLPTMNLRYSMLEVNKKDILKVLKERLDFCNHQECIMIVFDTLKLGHACNFRNIMKEVRAIRCEIPEFRYLSMIRDKIMNKFNINYRAGHPFIPVVPVYNNHDEYIKSKGKIKFRSWMRLTRKTVRDFIAGDISYKNLISSGALEYISADETAISYIAKSIEEFYNTCMDIKKMYDYSFLRASYNSLYMMRNASAHRAPVQRGMFASSQLKSAGERKSAAKYIMKKSTVIPGIQEPAYANITSFVQHATFNLMTCYIGDPAGQEEGSTVDGHAVSSGLAMEFCNDMIMHIIENGEQLLMRKDIPKCPDYIDDNGLPKIGTALKYKDPVIFIGSAQSSTHVTMITYKFYIDGHVTGFRIIAQSNNKLNISVKFTNVFPLMVSSKIAHTTGNKSIVSKCASLNDIPSFRNGVPMTVILPLSMCFKRYIYDNIVIIIYIGHDNMANSNSWHMLETGKQVYYPVHCRRDM